MNTAEGRELARDLVLAYGWNATCYQILNPGMNLWFSDTEQAVAGYTDCNGVLVVAGAPVCDPNALTAVCDEFEAFARRQDRRVCYVCAEDRLRHLLPRSSPHSTVAVGAQPAWNPRNWPAMLHSRASLRAQLRRAVNKGVVVEELRPERAVAARELRRVLHEWLQARRLPPLHFLVEPDVLDGVLTDRIILVARQSDRAVAFLIASPAPARRGYLVELLARGSGAPNGSGELLIDAAMRRFAGESCGYATLGLVALAHAADDQIRLNPRWLTPLMYFARAHANRFYNFRGLEQFRLKMAPERWEPVYAISNERRFSPRTLYAIGSAFSGIPPWLAIGLGIGKAAREEIRRLLNSGGRTPE